MSQSSKQPEFESAKESKSQPGGQPGGQSGSQSSSSSRFGSGSTSGQSNPFSAFSNPSEAFQSFASSIKVPYFDKESVMDHHRKNVDAMTDVNKAAVEAIKTIAQHQSQFVRQSFEDMNSMMRDVVGNPQDQLKNQLSKMKESVSRAIDHATNMSNLVAKSNGELYNAVQSHVSESVEGIKEAASKFTTKA
ncbi:MAG: phasin family protein [Alphaproteobacteria bacterium]|nr:phasin family protein [Alphaproteobacteria bacterium]